MKIGDMVRIPALPRPGGEYYRGEVCGIIVHTEQAWPHDCKEDTAYIVIVGADGKETMWFDWQAEIICEGM